MRWNCLVLLLGVITAVLAHWLLSSGEQPAGQQHHRGAVPALTLDNEILPSHDVALIERLAMHGHQLTPEEETSVPLQSSLLPPLPAPTQRAGPDFHLLIRVHLTRLAHAHPGSLQRLLDSLLTAAYHGEEVSLEIHLSMNASNLTEWKRSLEYARTFHWPHGSLRVSEQNSSETCCGYLWLEAWPHPREREVMLLLEDDVVLSPYYYSFIRRVVRSYYLDPAQYDANLFGFSLQTQPPVLGETVSARAEFFDMSQALNATVTRLGLTGLARELYRYQLVGTWGAVFFPAHWRAFTDWLKTNAVDTRTGVSATGVQACVPGLISNAWWQRKPHRVWAQWFVRFAFERGWYSLYTHLPRDDADAFSHSRHIDSGSMGLIGAISESTGQTFYPVVDEDSMAAGSSLCQLLLVDPLPPLHSLPLFDFHFQEVQHADSLQRRSAVWGDARKVPQCLTNGRKIMKMLKHAAHQEQRDATSASVSDPSAV